ncbi:MAG: hypothetical protein AAGE52_21345 [Myxococcota bacterium]
MWSSDRTAVTGAPLPGSAMPRPGQVVGERYELRHRLRDDPFSLGYLAFDQETEESVLLRIVRPELLDPSARTEVARSLRRMVGMGGKYLPGLIDADRDGSLVYASEALPEGVALRDVLDLRIAEQEPLKPFELLPVIAQIEAAVEAIPPTLRHGDLTALQIWLDADRLQVKGAFFVPSIPEGVVAAVLQRHGDVRRRVAPEVMRGPSGEASDLYSVAAIAYEALTLKPPPDPGTAVSSDLGALTRPLGALLHADPKRRATNLNHLVETLAQVAGLRVPDLEPAPFRTQLSRRRSTKPPMPKPSSKPPSSKAGSKAAGSKAGSKAAGSKAPSSEQPTTQARALSKAAAERALAGEIPDVATVVSTVSDDIAATSKMKAMTAEAAAAALGIKQGDEGSHHLSETESRVPSDPAIEAPPAKESSVDPRLMRMALAADKKPARRGRFPSDPGLAVEEGDEESSLDPRLVRAALSVTEDSEDEVPLDPSVPVQPRKDGTQELAMDELDFVDGVPLDPSVPVEARKDGTQELAMDELDVVEDDAPAKETHGTAQITLSDLEEMAADHRRAAVPQDVKAIPQPKADSGSTPTDASLYDDSNLTLPNGIGVPVVAQAATPRPPRVDVAAADAPQGSRRLGVTIILTALVLGLGIIIGSFLYARHRQNQADDERRQRLLERFQQVQQE